MENNINTSNLITGVLSSELLAHNVIANLFPIDERIYQSILANMKKDGFNKAYPLQVIENAEEKNYLVYDGLTRMKAAQELGLKEVPVLICQDKMNHDEILQKAIEIQSNRRPSSDEVQFICIEKLLEIAASQAKARQGTRNDLKEGADKSESISANAYIARIINKSQNYVRQARAIMKDPTLKEKVISGELTLDAAYKLSKKSEDSNTTDKDSTASNAINPIECTTGISADKTISAGNESETSSEDTANPRAAKNKKISVPESFLKAVLGKLGSLSPEALEEIAKDAPQACHNIIKEVQHTVNSEKNEPVKSLSVKA
ncbi:MAG: hypothetical protein A2017_09270 [Lentisphaerae bacterium GWF2_44_16]|nr:MAG: hypothetical protein A2017_09270 [Lentisphaerae bacterium GWF2_44_16]